tara:strand:- start:2641 stop:3690 length:1050 start_codon:yes stop_codon:yes gene_type:complete
LNVLDLFSGIGGFSLGLESTGFFKTIAFVEKDEFCKKVLRKNFPNVPIEDEVRNVKGERFKADVITGGFPCQPFSVAGKRRGTEDDRFLWDETIRIVSEQKPKWFIGENVEGIINIQDGMVFRQIHDDLESEGFEVQSLVIPASGVGAWHQRKRVWIIANSNGGLRGRRRTIEQSGENEVRRIYSSKEEQARNDLRSKAVGCDAVSGKTENVSNSNTRQRIRSRKPRNFNQEKRFETSSSTQFNGSSSNVSNTKSKRSFWNSKSKSSFNEQQRLDNNKKRIRSKIRSKSSRCSEQTSWWQTQSNFCGIPDGVSYELDKDRANRIKSLGNSIVPQIAREIGKAIMEAELG